MSLFHAFFLISIFWIIAHLLHRICNPREPLNSALLPTLSTHAPRPRTRSRFAAEKSTTITINKIHLKIQTDVFNVRHDQLAGKLKDRRFTRYRRWTTAFYNAGISIGMCGMVFALSALIWITANHLVKLLLASPKLPNLRKRDFGSVNQDGIPQDWIQPIIPGVTVPLGHLPIIIFAVFLCQIVHELGHAVAGALSSVPLFSSGLSLTFVIPSAFVSFSSEFLDSLDALTKARIIAAGPWHNLVLLVVLLISSRSAVFIDRTTGLGSALISMCWRDVSNEGRVVVGLDEDSSLNAVLDVGSMITALDDVPLKGEKDSWSQYLTQNTSDKLPWPGWCVSQQDFQSRSSECCEDARPTLDHLCFNSIGSSGKSCVDPIPIFSNALRCRLGSDCVGDAVCARPDSSILRLSVRGQDLILWNGPRQEIWEQVSIGRYAPRFWFIPTGAIRVAEDFWDYLLMATLSLFFFNLLPLPHLDGIQLLSAVLDHLMPSPMPAIDPESGMPQRGAATWRRRLEKFAQHGTTGLLMLYVILVALQARAGVGF